MAVYFYFFFAGSMAVYLPLKSHAFIRTVQINI